MGAKRPSKRRHRLETEVELKLIPVMSLLCVLIPILLQAAVFVRTAAQEVNLPSADQVNYLNDATRAALAQSLTVALTESGFTVASGDRTLARLPRSSAGYDFAGLGKVLAEAKQRQPSQEAVILLVGDGILYDDIIHAMDRCRPHFPAISLADRLAVPGGG